MKKRIVLILIALLIVIQFIRPARNLSATPSPNDISQHYKVPDTVAGILQRACNDCHSNNTRYPWYTNIQPVGWWMQDHVNDGKKELNFSEFGTYTAKRQNHKMEEVAEQVKKGEMPLNSYLWIHKDAILTDHEKEILISWANEIRSRIIVPASNK
jgi:hypothetical protein